MQGQEQQTNQFDRHALRELAQARINGLTIRAAFYMLGGVTGGAFVPPLWVAICLTLIAVAEVAEYRAARALLAWDPPGRGGGTPPGANALAITHIATTIAVALALAATWAFTGSSAKVLPLCLLAIATFNVVQVGPQVLSLMMLRQALYVGTGVGMTLRDLLLNESALPSVFVFQGLAIGVLPVLLLASVVLAVSHDNAIAYRDRMIRDQKLTKARDTAVRADAAKSGFIATISHELRTPLNGVVGMAQTLLSTELTEGQRQQVEVISESGRNLNTLLDDILDYSKLEAGKLSIEPKCEDLRLTAEHVARLYGPMATDKGLELQASVDPEVPAWLVFDAVRVRQCLSNLVSNAIKFTKTGSVRMTLSGAAREPSPEGPPYYLVTAVVADTGIGIPTDHQAHLFQPFNQADGNIAGQYGGTGLGLSITRQLVESMGGTVNLESRAGEGSMFRMTFNAGLADDGRTDESAAQGDGEIIPKATSCLVGQRVLIADDIETNRVAMRLILQPLGVEVVEVADGAAALDALTGTRFSAALVKMHMPGIGGAEFAARVRRGGGGRENIPLLAVIADNSVSDIDTSIDGFDGVITKPVDARQLPSRLIGAMLRRAQHRPFTSKFDDAPGA